MLLKDVYIDQKKVNFKTLAKKVNITRKKHAKKGMLKKS